MLNSFADFERVIRDIVFSNVTPDMRFCFSTSESQDASVNAAGDLFKQDADFLMFETEIDQVSRAGPSWSSPRRAWGALTISLLTKDPTNSLDKREIVEQVANWFGDQTLSGIRFRQFMPIGKFPLMGFQAHDGLINCDFELRATTR